MENIEGSDIKPGEDPAVPDQEIRQAQSRMNLLRGILDNLLQRLTEEKKQELLRDVDIASADEEQLRELKQKVSQALEELGN